MNQDTSYERVRWRQNQKNLDTMGLSAAYITKSTQRLQRAKDALDFYVDKFIQQHLHKSSYGFVSVVEKDFISLPEEIRIRVVMHLFKMMAQTNKILSLESVEKIALNLPKYATLAGCQWIISQKKIFVAPENKYLIKQSMTPNKWTPWGTLSIWTNQPFQLEASTPRPRIKDIPFLVQRTFLKTPS